MQLDRPKCKLMLLAVLLFIKDGKAKLANALPVSSKIGVDLAKACFEACKLDGKICEEEIKLRVVGKTADGGICQRQNHSNQH